MTEEVQVERVYVGLDWAEDHHDVFIEDDTGRRLAGGRVPEGVEGGSSTATQLAMAP